MTSSAEASEYKERLRIVASTRAAQRGVECSEVCLRDLLNGVAGSSDVVDIVDLHPYNGDLAMACCKLRMASALKPRLRCWMVDIAGKHGTHSSFAVKRQSSICWKVLAGCIGI